MTQMGPNMDPHQAYLVIRGLKTLALRIDVLRKMPFTCRYLESIPKISWIRYPGLESHPQFELALRQQNGPGAMISFGLKGGFKAGATLMDNVKISLGSFFGWNRNLNPASCLHDPCQNECRR